MPTMAATKTPQQRRDDACRGARGLGLVASASVMCVTAAGAARPARLTMVMMKNSSTSAASTRQWRSSAQRRRALLRLGEHDALVFVLLVHGDIDTHAANRASSPPQPRSISSTANSRNS